VIVSIQGLILGTAKPYFLEAGFEKYIGTVDGERASEAYNENAMLLAIRAMLFMLQYPIVPFEGMAERASEMPCLCLTRIDVS
jgi:ubiquitin-conjugating enzyme E2 O